MSEEEVVYQTLKFEEAAYCIYKGLELADRKPMGTRTLITLRQPKNWVGPSPENIAKEFYNSEAKKIMEAFRTIKDYAYKSKNEN